MGRAVPRKTRLAAWSRLGGQDHRAHRHMSPPDLRIGRRKAARIDHARHRLARLRRAFRLGRFSAMLRAFTTCKTQYAIDGTAQAQAVFPRLGFEQKPRIAIFHKVLAPFQSLCARRGRGASANGWEQPGTWFPFGEIATPPVSRSLEFARADVHRRNRLPATAVFTTHGDVPARSLAAQLFPSLSIAGLYGLDDSRIRANDRHRHLEDHSARPNPAWQDRGLLARHDDPSCWQAAIAALIDRLRALAADTVTCLPRPRACTRHCSGMDSPKRGKETCTCETNSNAAPRSSFRPRDARGGSCHSLAMV